LGVLWCLFFWWWFRDRPEEHPRVNPAELALIHGEMKKEDGRKNQDKLVIPSSSFSRSPSEAAEKKMRTQESESHANVPWLRLLGSANLWSLCLMYFCSAYGWYFNITWLPKYLSNVYGVSEKTHGFWTMSVLSGLPLLFGSLACLFGGLLTDAFIRRTGDRKWGRRLFGVLGHGICAFCYFASLGVSSPWLFVLTIALAAFWNDLTMGAAWASCIDIGGRYSGIVSGCMNTVGNLGGAAAGIATGLVLDYFGPYGWTVNFLLFGSVYVAAIFLWLHFDATKPIVFSA